MKFIPKLLLLFFTINASNALAQTFESGEAKATLIELYTSEGCSSCPPADKWLSKLKSHPNLWTKIVPVAFHVDYWDWIGWKDDFAKPEFGKRQKHYKSLRNTRSVYTPGFFVNGFEWRDFFRSKNAEPPTNTNRTGKLKAEFQDGNLTASFQAIQKPYSPKALKLNVAELSFDKSNFIKFGENIGKTLNHDFIVNNLTSYKLTEANGIFAASTLIPPFNKQTTGIAIWVSDPKTGDVLQATGGMLSK